ncbi:MAG TPA: hypothetical protein VEB42_06200 [Chitinophagaceae bacterium]|nr:hypothetical protein [Chitinophagaceae bacterium]
MNDDIVVSGNVAFLAASETAVFFSKGSADAGASKVNVKGTALPIKQLQNQLNVAFWGEDNRYPQNVEQQMAYCGVGKQGLEKKAKALYGAGIIPGRVKDLADDGKTEIFEPLKRGGADKHIYTFLEKRSMFRFWMEYFMDWSWYSNCFPETILSKDCTTITDLVHQESCDARFRQMNGKGEIDTVYLSKLWGAAGDQYAKFDPKKRMKGLIENKTDLFLEDNEFVKQLHCIDMYNPVESLTTIAQKLKGRKGLKSAILPVNFPSPNKTYYQVPSWDGARLAGWVEIASKVPAILKHFFNKARKIRRHIEVPEDFFPIRFGAEKWRSMDADKQTKARKDLLKEMDAFFTKEDADFNTFISFYNYDKVTKAEHGRWKITNVEDTSSIDKDLITSSAADIQILTAMGIHPTLVGGGTIGTGQQRSGGSDQREAWLLYTAMLGLERQVALEPLYLVRDFNKWDEDIVFRVRDTVLTTLDQGKGTEKKVS